MFMKTDCFMICLVRLALVDNLLVLVIPIDTLINTKNPSHKSLAVSRFTQKKSREVTTKLHTYNILALLTLF